MKKVTIDIGTFYEAIGPNREKKKIPYGNLKYYVTLFTERK